MAKFTSAPYFLLKDYFDKIMDSSPSSTTNTVIHNSYLKGHRAAIVAKGGYWTELFIKMEKDPDDELYSYPGFIAFKFRPKTNYIEDDYFNFSKGALVTLPASANGLFESGSEVYFKKGSYLHTWVENNDSTYGDYVNTRRPFLYFGKIYPINETEGDTTDYRIIFYGMKNYVMDALPEHNRTDNLKEFMKLYFDNIYSKIYSLQRDISTLLDVRESDLKYLKYFAAMYNVDLDDSFDLSNPHNIVDHDEKIRSWVKNLVYLLKRKGTYSSLFIIWKTLTNGTTDTLNVYNRWHLNLTDITDIPLGNFTDILHEMSYGVEPVGCAGSYWYQNSLSSIAGSTLHIQANAATTWDIYHEMYSKYIIAQCYDNNFRRIWPISITAISTGHIRLVFNTSVSGYAFLIRKGDYQYLQTSSSASWDILHRLAQKELLTQFGNSDYTAMMPMDVTLTDVNKLLAEFNIATEGYGLLEKDVTTVIQAIAATTWTLTHSLGSKYVFVQAYDSDDMEIQPISITLTDENTCTLVFESAESGYAVVKVSENTTTLPDYGPDDMILSTHYKVEMDLSCQPLDNLPTSTAIIGEETIDRLITNWELMRPVSRFAHYHELISPKTDFTGNYVSLYNAGYYAGLQTKYVVSAGELVPPVSASEMVYEQSINSSSWTINHEFNTKNFLVQCYDEFDYRIFPSSIQALTTTTVKINFGTPMSGIACLSTITPSGYLSTESASATTWNVNHLRGIKEVLSQFDSTTSTKIVPSAVYLEDTENMIAVWSIGVNGYALVSDSEIVISTTEAGTIWTVDHYLGSDSVLVQVYNDDDYMIEPISVYLDSRNRCTITFHEAVSGYAILKGINKSITEQDVVNSLSTWMIGCGTSGSNYDPLPTNSVEVLLASSNTLDSGSDDDYYYVSFEVDNVVNSGEDWNITELALLDYEGKIKFYTYCDTIHKPSNVWFNAHFRIAKGQT